MRTLLYTAKGKKFPSIGMKVTPPLNWESNNNMEKKSKMWKLEESVFFYQALFGFEVYLEILAYQQNKIGETVT